MRPTPSWPAWAVIPQLALALATLGVACDESGSADDPAPFVAALPTEGLLFFTLPDDEPASVAGGLSIDEMPLVGEQSQLHALGREVQRSVNRALSQLLLPIQRTVRSQEPVVTGGTRAVWLGQPAGDPDRYLLVVERKPAGHFEYTLWARDAAGGDAPWRFRVFGTTTPTDQAGRGRGLVWVDLDTDRLDETSGKVLALWSDVRGGREVTVNFFDARVTGGNTAGMTSSAFFSVGADGGVLAFGLPAYNIHSDARTDRAAPETVRVLSRWRAGGRGRTDASAFGPDITADGYRFILVSQCWRLPGFDITYEQRLGFRPNEDAPARIAAAGDLASCAFERHETPVALNVGSPPSTPRPPAELDGEPTLSRSPDGASSTDEPR